MFRAVLHIARNTFRENLRQPIYLLILLVALTLTGTLPAFTLFVFREQIKLVMDTSMAAMLSFGWILAVLTASHAVTHEIHSGTAMLLLSKPVDRFSFIAGKVAGLLAGLTLFCFLMSVASMIAVRVAADQFNFDPKGLFLYFAAIAASCAVGGIANFIRRTSFPMATVLAMLVCFPAAALILRFLPVSGERIPYAWQMAPALILVTYAVWVLGILATALSTRLELMQNMMICAVVFVVGLMSDYLVGGPASDSLLWGILYAAIPNWQLFWAADALAADKAIPLAYVLWGGLYVLLFGAFFLALGVAMFARREVGEQRVS